MQFRKHHKIILFITTLCILGGGLIYWKTAFGVTRTWDGGGTDGTCGGAGTANNWTCAANWVGDVAPGASDIASFDGTSTKNATINANISVAGINIAAGYSGIITQSSTFTVTVGSSHFVQAAGTFTGGNSAMTINGTFTLSGGIFTSTSGILAIGGNFTHTAGGTFNHNNGTVNLGNGVNAVLTADVATSETFNNLTIDPYAPQTYVIASGDTLIVLGTFTHMGSYLDTGTVEARGNVVVGTGASGGTGTISFLVSGDQTITGNSGKTCNLNIGKSSGTVNAGSANFGTGSFTLSGGTFTSTSGILAIGGSFTHTAGGTFNHNNGTVNLGEGMNLPFTADVTTSETFNNLTINPYAPQTYNIASGDTLIALGTFTHTGGFLSAGTIEARGNVVIGAAANGGTTTLSFTGGNNQTYTDNGGNEVDGDVTVNKSGGTVTLASNADWNATNQDVTITAGTLAQSTYNITTTNFTVNGGTFTGGSGTLTTAGPMLVSSGTFTGGAGNVTVNNTYTLSGGAFIAPSGTLQVGMWLATSGTFFTVSGGTFNHNNGTVSFNEFCTGCGSVYTYTIDVASSLTLYNVNINSDHLGGSAKIITPASGDTIIVVNNFTQTDGSIGGTWEIQGNVIIGSNADGGDGTLTYTTSGSHTYAYTAGGSGPHLRVNHSSATVSAAGGTTDLKVSGFSLLNGVFIAPSSTLSVGRYVGASETIFSVSSGTFNHNNGTVSLVEGCSGCGLTYTYTIDVASSLTLYNVNINSDHLGGPAKIITTAAGDTIIVAGNFIHTDGAVAGTWEAQGNYTVATTADGGSAGITFTGGNTQIYTDQGGNEPDGDVTINKTANSVTLASNADWNAASQDLTITAGTLLQPSNYAVATGAVTVGASGKWVNNGTGAVTLGGAVANAGLIDFRSSNTCGGSDTIALHSSTNGVQRAWSGAGTFVMRDIEVKDQGGSAAITAYSSTNTSGNGGNWTFSGAACPVVPTPKAGLPSGYTRLQGGKVNLR